MNSTFRTSYLLLCTTKFSSYPVLALSLHSDSYQDIQVSHRDHVTMMHYYDFLFLNSLLTLLIDQPHQIVLLQKQKSAKRKQAIYTGFFTAYSQFGNAIFSDIPWWRGQYAGFPCFFGLDCFLRSSPSAPIVRLTSDIKSQVIPMYVQDPKESNRLASQQ